MEDSLKVIDKDELIKLFEKLFKKQKLTDWQTKRLIETEGEFDTKTAYRFYLNPEGWNYFPALIISIAGQQVWSSEINDDGNYRRMYHTPLEKYEDVQNALDDGRCFIGELAGLIVSGEFSKNPYSSWDMLCKKYNFMG
jgi:hypothetical protein